MGSDELEVDWLFRDVRIAEMGEEPASELVVAIEVVAEEPPCVVLGVCPEKYDMLPG